MNKERLEFLKEKKAEIKKMKDDVIKASNSVFTEMCAEFFENYPRLEKFGWTQYTPYFNDGDTCEFSANIDYGISINDSEYAEDEDWYSERNIKSHGTFNRVTREYEGRIDEPNPKFDKELVEITKDIKEFLKHFDNDFYKSQFGDHARVVVSRSGVNVDEYDHD